MEIRDEHLLGITNVIDCIATVVEQSGEKICSSISKPGDIPQWPTPET